MRLSDLTNASLVLFQRSLNPRIYDHWLDRLRGAGLAGQIVFETKQIHTALTMVQNDGGLFIASSYSTEFLPVSLRWIPFEGFDTSISVGMIWKANRPSA